MMRVGRLSRQGRRGAAIIVAGLIVLAALAASPFLLRQSLEPELADARQLMALIDARLKAAEANRKPMLVTAANAGEAFVPGTTAGLATASLQRLLVKLAGDNGLRVEKVQPLPAEEKDGLAHLRLDIETAGSLEALRGFLVAAEGGAPLLFVREAHLTTPVNGQAAAGEASANLAMSLSVEAYGWWGPKP